MRARGRGLSAELVAASTETAATGNRRTPLTEIGITNHMPGVGWRPLRTYNTLRPDGSCAVGLVVVIVGSPVLGARRSGATVTRMAAVVVRGNPTIDPTILVTALGSDA